MPHLQLYTPKSVVGKWPSSNCAELQPYHFGLLLHAHATFTASFPRLEAQHIGAEALSLTQLEANLSIGMQTKGQRGLRRHGFIYVLQHLHSMTFL